MSGTRQKTLGKQLSQTLVAEGRGEALDAEAEDAEPLMAKPAPESPALAEQFVPIRLTQTPTIYSMRQPWRRNAVRRRIDKGSGQFLTVLKSGGGLKSLRKLNSEEGWVNGKHIQRGSC